jgi:DNA-binding beta-propeller fold protein YncE
VKLFFGPMLVLSLGICSTTLAQQEKPAAFQPVPELPYRVATDFFQFPTEAVPGEVAAVALNSKGHIFVFQRSKPNLIEFDPTGKFVRSIGEGLFTIPHGLRIDGDDNLWITDTGSNIVLKLNSDGRVLLILGRRGSAAEADWLFNKPADIAFGKDGEFFIADGYGNSRIMKFDHNGKFLKSWGVFGKGPGEFQLPHSIVIDKQGHIYVADREGERIQIFDYDGNFLKEWKNIGYPYGLFLTPDQHIWMADGGYDRVLEFDPNGKILGAIGEPGHAPGQFAWAHFLAVGPNRNLYVADVLNWRVDVFLPTGTAPTGKMSSYVPSKRMFQNQVPSTGWTTRHGN